jgi:hypothetical protein
MKLAILELARPVMDTIVERQQAEASIVRRCRDAVHKTADTVEVGGEALAIERDAVALDERVEIAGKFLRPVQHRDADYDATIAGAPVRFAHLIERR